jgi:hypothetical protein
MAIFPGGGSRMVWVTAQGSQHMGPPSPHKAPVCVLCRNQPGPLFLEDERKEQLTARSYHHTYTRYWLPSVPTVLFFCPMRHADVRLIVTS